MSYYTLVVTIPDKIEDYGQAYYDVVNRVALTHRDNEKWVYDPEDKEIIFKQAQVYVDCLERRLKQMLVSGNMYNYFIQLEQGEKHKRWHIHVVLDISVGNPRNCREVIEKVEYEYNSICYGRPVRQTQINRTSNGSWKIETEDFIINYLLCKIPPKEAKYAWTNIKNKIGDACLNIDLRKEISVRPDIDVPMWRQASGDRMRDLVEWCIKNHVFTEDQYMAKFEESYYSFACTNQGRHMLQTSLELAAKRTTSMIPLGVYLAGFANIQEAIEEANKTEFADIYNNKVFDLLQFQGYDPVVAGYIIYAWSIRATGRRGALWFYGPGQTGKSIMARAMATCSVRYGCVNWTNSNFPFQDLATNCQIGWWEEGVITEDIVESAKALLSGGKIRVDRKCRDSVEITPPPFVITSNNDMTLVQGGNQVSFVHKKPLEDRMIKFNFNKRLPPNFGIVEREDMKQFFKWSSFIYYNKLLPKEQAYLSDPNLIGHVVPYTSFLRQTAKVEKIVRPFEEQEQEDLAELDSWFADPPYMGKPPKKSE
nr:nonstructural protein [bovine parvovirus 2]